MIKRMSTNLPPQYVRYFRARTLSWRSFMAAMCVACATDNDCVVGEQRPSCTKSLTTIRIAERRVYTARYAAVLFSVSIPSKIASKIIIKSLAVILIVESNNLWHFTDVLTSALPTDRTLVSSQAILAEY